MTNSENEIDIIDIIYRIILFLKKYKMLLLCCIIIGVGIGLYKHFSQSKIYSKQFIVTSGFSSDLLINMVKQLNNYVIQEDYQALSEKLNINIETSKKIVSIETDSMPLTVKTTFKINISVSEPSISDTVSKNVIYYLQDNTYLNHILESNINAGKELLKKLNEKLKIYDSIGPINNFSAQTFSGNKFIGNYYLEYMTLYEKKVDIERRIQNGDEIKVIDSYYITEKNQHGFIKRIFSYVSLIVAIGIFIALIIETNKIIKKKYNLKK